MEETQKLQNLEKALGANAPSLSNKPTLNLGASNASPKGESKLNLNLQKSFGGNDSKLTRAAFDHKGKNKEVLKGNAKSKAKR